MEKLAMTCQVLYDVDLLNAKKEVCKIRKQLKENTVPKIIYKDNEEFENLRIEAIKICQQGVREMLSNDTELYMMREYGITLMQENVLYRILFKAFDKISKGQANEWISNYALISNYSIQHTIRALVDTDPELWNHIFDELGRDGLNTFILKIVMRYFEESDYEVMDSINVIRHFKCDECGKIDDYKNNGKCYNCDEKNNFK